jgi:hypothetical protein
MGLQEIPKSKFVLIGVLETEIQTPTYNFVYIVLKSNKLTHKVICNLQTICSLTHHLSNLIALKFGLSVIFALKLNTRT